MSGAPNRRRVGWRWLPPLALSVFVPLTAPWVGAVRSGLERGLGVGRYIEVLAVALVVSGLVVFGLAVAWIWRRSPRREALRSLALLAVALGLVASQVLLAATGNRKVDLVERVHLIEYASIAFLFMNALRHRVRDLALPVLALGLTVLVGLVDEWVQWLTSVRVGDMGDVYLNGLAGAIGVLFALALVPPERLLARPTPASLRAVRWLGPVVILGWAAVFACTNQGYLIVDPQAGTFLSYRSPAELLDARADRRARWSRSRPPRPAPLVLEDTYLTEAGFHVATRNNAFQAGRYRHAWVENLILERWYPAFLDLRSFRSGVTHRWPPPQRKMVAERAGTYPARRYRSPVLSDRLKPVSGALLWGGATAGAALWWLALLRLGRLDRGPAGGRDRARALVS